MDLVLNRLWITPHSTCGELSIDGLLLYTLELPVKNGLPGSAIPPGRYQVTLEESPRFMKSVDAWVEQYAKAMPHVVGIRKRSEIMFHWLNYPSQTDGCRGVGLTREDNFICV